MKIQRTRCDQCGREHDITDAVIEVSKVQSLYRPQLERDLPTFVTLPQMQLWTYDFCTMKCLSEWALKEASNPGSETAPK